MEPHKIESLVEKYLAGNTSLEEEKILHDYFAREEDIPENLLAFKPLFGFFRAERQETSEVDVLLPKPKSYKWPVAVAAIAAVIIIFLMVTPFSENNSPANDNAQMAAQNAQGLFMMMGGAIKESRQNLGYLKELNATKNQLISKKLSK